MKHIKVCQLKSPKDFHRTNLDLIKGHYKGLESSVSSHALGNRLHHWSAKLIDRRCRVERQVNLNSVVLNHDVYVDRNTLLDNTIVMPDTLVPANQNISNAIIHREHVYHV